MTETLYIANDGSHVSLHDMLRINAGDKYCPKQARRTPSIPYHNGSPCLACGRVS